MTYWDSNTKGLGLRVSQGGAKTFIVLVGSGKRHKIGRYPDVTLQAARVEAKRTLGEVALGQYLPKTIASTTPRHCSWSLPNSGSGRGPLRTTAVCSTGTFRSEGGSSARSPPRTSPNASTGSRMRRQKPTTPWCVKIFFRWLIDAVTFR